MWPGSLMGMRSRRKGARVEREVVALLREAGIPAERVPLSGAAGGSFTGDVVIADRWRAEVKARKSGDGFKTLAGWLGSNDLLVLKQNHADPIVVFPWRLAVVLLAVGLAVGPVEESRTCEVGSG